MAFVMVNNYLERNPRTITDNLFTVLCPRDHLPLGDVGELIIESEINSGWINRNSSFPRTAIIAQVELQIDF